MNRFSLVASIDLKLIYTGCTDLNGTYASFWWLCHNKPELKIWLHADYTRKLGKYE